eukprot:CAMPEP_0194750482 /NCGR_PEP_ID=MMETSP0323_2-20130528/4543_1 /TAXON_ID=2866 ORGANISM="Crypthecodinium cohnii, Strain Seligo" /NCGR_SAMPLE_ID=MMETSP0323_2 /ASSEMBLY_ACC=CAM_ASM_000346 /LENGTH=125 /DNA_ID=CAMNT_0039666247 /DNA_START=118 /DNA_END=495 /DNA_ORIENTATION=+
MKAMKAMKTMKTMKAASGMKKAMKKAMKVSVIAKGPLAKSRVFKGKKEKTVGGLTKDKLTKNKFGKVVSKSASARAKKNFANSKLKSWGLAVKAARKALGITGFVPIGGKTASGKALYAKAKSLL